MPRRPNRMRFQCPLLPGRPVFPCLPRTPPSVPPSRAGGPGKPVVRSSLRQRRRHTGSEPGRPQAGRSGNRGTNGPCHGTTQRPVELFPRFRPPPRARKGEAGRERSSASCGNGSSPESSTPKRQDGGDRRGWSSCAFGLVRGGFPRMSALPKAAAPGCSTKPRERAWCVRLPCRRFPDCSRSRCGFSCGRLAFAPSAEKG